MLLKKKLIRFIICLVVVQNVISIPSNPLIGDDENNRSGITDILNNKEQELEQLRQENAALKKQRQIDDYIAFGFLWKKFDPILPDTSVTKVIPDCLSLSSYSYPDKYYGNVGNTLGYLSCATLFSIGLELREMRREIMKRGEYWDPVKIKLAIRSSFARRALTMGAAFPMFVYTLENMKKVRFANKDKD